MPFFLKRNPQALLPNKEISHTLTDGGKQYNLKPSFVLQSLKSNAVANMYVFSLELNVATESNSFSQRDQREREKENIIYRQVYYFIYGNEVQLFCCSFWVVVMLISLILAVFPILYYIFLWISFRKCLLISSDLWADIRANFTYPRILTVYQ